MTIKRLQEIIERIRKVSIAVYGDYCLDAYWILDPRGSEISVETGLKAQAVSKHYYSLGGAANVVANLAALEPAHIQAIGVVGDDIFGRELQQQLQALGADTSWLVIQKENFATYTYCKTFLEDKEQPRVDFGIFNQRSENTDTLLLDGLRNALETLDVVILNQQIPNSITHESFIIKLNALLRKFSNKIIVLDSRHYGHHFNDVYRKVNESEAARLNNVRISPDDRLSLAELGRFAENLYRKSQKPLFISRGLRGILVYDKRGAFQVPGIQLLNRVDTVGAGDTILSALACSLAAHADPQEAAEFANFAAAVTVQKLFQTGVATAGEILAIAKDPDYIYQPELAEDIRQARYVQNSEIEICSDFQAISCGKISHAVFDHDGTISTLRQGWEAIMEPVMMKAILGEKYNTASETLYHKILSRVRDYIDKSTGIQTIIQMEALVELVKEFNIIPADKILDKFGYKKIYNDALMEMVRQRLTKLQRNELDVNDYTIKGALPMLQALCQKGVTLYLASGTDRDDVIAEAKALGYAELFNGGIYGCIGDIRKYSKKIVIENILQSNNLQGPQLACFGDGPVEMRECRKHDGIAIGIASDELQRHGLGMKKRTRLIKAGAHIIVPDFSQADMLLELLFKP
jgi:rfaE bifunctional protein kinase chain/domain